jgi:heavy metal translocating P-type ATPase
MACESACCAASSAAPKSATKREGQSVKTSATEGCGGMGDEGCCGESAVQESGIKEPFLDNHGEQEICSDSCDARCYTTQQRSHQRCCAPSAAAEEDQITRLRAATPEPSTLMLSYPASENTMSCCVDISKTSCCNNKTSRTSGTSRAVTCCEPAGTDCAPSTQTSSCTALSVDGTADKTKASYCAVLTSGFCSDKKTNAIVDTSEITPTRDNADIEKGSTGREHVILSVSGMTCTGCETKLKRTLGTLKYIANLRISLVLARVEFDIPAGPNTAEDVIKHLHRTTEFKCEKVSNQGASLDLICSGDQMALIKGDWPDGVLEVKSLDKWTVRVDFDAEVIGARDLLDKEWSQGLRLAPPRADPTLHAGSRHVRHMMLMTLLSAVLTIPVLVMAWAPLPERRIAYNSASLALGTIVQVVIAGPFYPKAIKALVFSRVIEMDLLIVLSTSAAYIFSVVSFGYLVVGKPLSTGEFFETSTLLVTLIMVGRSMASLARQKAAESISIRSLQAPNAVLVAHDGSEKEIDARLLQYGDGFKVAPDTRIPTDGTVMLGISEVDESMLTGESKLVEKRTGSTVIAGSINGNGLLTVRLTRLPGDNTITTIACMVDEAKLSKPKIQDLADMVASYFVPVVVVLTITTFVIWIAVGVAVRHQSSSDAAVNAITYAITVLIVSCPCAIGLAVPMVIVLASGVAANRGVVFKSAGSIEVAYKTTDVVLDKTGTLTEGRLSVAREEFFDHVFDQITTKAILLGLLSNVKHPVSRAVAAHLTGDRTNPRTVIGAKALPGNGVEGTFEGKSLRAGNSRWVGISQHAQIQAMLSQGLTTFCFTIDRALVAVFGLRDTLRHDAASTVVQLRQRGINVHILSGDDDGAVQAVASQLNILNGNVRSRCSPADKQAYIKSLLATPAVSSSAPKPHRPIVMFIGDGTNDAVALAQATIGVHMSSGTDIAQSAADVVLVRPNLSGILILINISKKAMRRIAFNFGWSFVYNLFAVLLGAGAFVHARIPPEYAGLGELVSVLPVIVAAVLLRWSRI